MSRPRINPQLLSVIADGVPKRALRRLDKNPTLADEWRWTTDGDTTRVQTGTEQVTLTAVNGRVDAPEHVTCTCLLAPKCLHVAAVLSLLEPAEAAATDGEPPETATGPPTSKTPDAATPAQTAAADHLWSAAAELLRSGAASARTVLIAELMRAEHACRVAGLFRLAAAGRRVITGLRGLRLRRAEVSLSELTGALAETLTLAHALRAGRGSAELVGQARRRYGPIGSLRLSGLCTEAVVVGGYAGVTTVLVDAEGRRWSLPDLQPGDVDRIAQAYRAGVTVGDTVLPHRKLVRQGLFLSGATGSEDGRLGAGQGVKAVSAGASTWDDEALATSFRMPIRQQIERAFADGPGREGLLTVEGTVEGTDGVGVLLSLDDGRSLRCLPAHRHESLPAVANMELLARAPGLRLRLVARLRATRAGDAALIAVGPAHGAPAADTPALALPAAWGGRCNVSLDALERSYLTKVQPTPARTTTPPRDELDPLRPLTRRLERAVLSGARSLPPGSADEVTKEAARLAHLGLPTAAEVHRALAQTAMWTRQTMWGTRQAVDPTRFATAWLAARTYERAARDRMALNAWLAG